MGYFCSTTNILDAIEQIKKDFHYFPELHQLWAACPNVNPPAITTGVGPHGRSTLYIQPLLILLSETLLSTLVAVLVLILPIQSHRHPCQLHLLSLILCHQLQLLVHLHNPGWVTRMRHHLCHVPNHILMRLLRKLTHLHIKKIPQKWSFEDRIIELQEYVSIIIIVEI